MPPRDKKTGMIELRISPETKERLRAKAANEGRSMSEVLRRLIHVYLVGGPAYARRNAYMLALAKRYPARILATITGLATLAMLPLSLANATPITLQVKGEIGTRTQEAISTRKFETTVQTEPGKRYVLVPTGGRQSDYSVSVEVRPLDDGTHEISFEIVDRADGANAATFEPRLITKAGEPAKVHIDRGAGLYLVVEADIAVSAE